MAMCLMWPRCDQVMLCCVGEAWVQNPQDTAGSRRNVPLPSVMAGTASSVMLLH